METLVQKKIKIRKQMKFLLKALEPEEKRRMDEKVCEQFLAMPEIQNVEAVYGYMALSWETGTEEILKSLWERGVRVALPKVMGEEMDFFEVHSLDDLAEGAFHILEPKETCGKVDWPEAVLLVPGLAFSRNGKRLGKGGGFYDKYLEQHPKHKTIALAYGFQIVEDIPCDVHDRYVEWIVTEHGSFICGK